MSSVTGRQHRYATCYDEESGGDARSQGVEEVRDPDRSSGVGVLPAAPHLPGRGARSGTRRWRTCPRCRQPAIEAVRAAPGRQEAGAGRGPCAGDPVAARTGTSPRSTHRPRRLGLPALLGPPGGPRDLALALIIARVCRPGSKLATTRGGPTPPWAQDLGVAGASTDEVYAAMDWLADRQDGIEKALATRHLGPEANPDRLALFDLSSSWVTGHALPAGGPGLLPRREEGPAADRVRAAHRPGRAARSRSGCSPATPPTRPRSAPSSTRVRDPFGLDEHGDGRGPRA